MKRVVMASADSYIDVDTDSIIDETEFTPEQVSQMVSQVNTFADEVESIITFVENATGYSYSEDNSVSLASENLETSRGESVVKISCSFEEVQRYFMKALHRMFENRMESLGMTLDAMSQEGTSVESDVPDESNDMMSYSFTVKSR